MSLRVEPRKGSPYLYVRGTVRGIYCYESTETADPKLAEMYRAKREAGLYEESLFGSRAVVSFARAALSYLEFEARSDGTKARVAKLVEHFGGILLAKVDQGAADKAVRAIVGEDAAPATKVREVYTPLSAIITHAAERIWCSPVKFKKPALPKGRTRWLTPAEALALLDAAAPHLRPLLHFILCTGARLSEALELDWADVDLPGARVVFRDTKSGKDRVAALPEAAVLTLANLPIMEGENAEQGRADSTGGDGVLLPRMGMRDGRVDHLLSAPLRKGRVFRRDDGEPYADKHRQGGGQIKTGFGSACRRAQIRDASPHTLRHTWATWAYAVTRDPMLVKEEGGWASLALVERYAHLAPSETRFEVYRVWGDRHPVFGELPRRAAAEKARTA